MFRSLSADKSLYNYSLFRVGWSTNRRENKAGRSTRLFLIIWSCSQVQEKSRGVWDICLGPAQIQPDQATASRDSAEPEPGDTWWWCQQPKPQREDPIGRQLSDPGGFQDYYEQCKTLALSLFIFSFPASPSPHEPGSFLGDDKREENPFEMNEHYQMTCVLSALPANVMSVYARNLLQHPFSLNLINAGTHRWHTKAEWDPSGRWQGTWCHRSVILQGCHRWKAYRCFCGGVTPSMLSGLLWFQSLTCEERRGQWLWTSESLRRLVKADCLASAPEFLTGWVWDLRIFTSTTVLCPGTTLRTTTVGYGGCCWKLSNSIW